MARNLGVKHTCFQCGTRFYDFNKPVPVCPKCGVDQRLAPKKESAAQERKKARAKEAEAEEPEATDAEAETEAVPAAEEDGEDAEDEEIPEDADE